MTKTSAISSTAARLCTNAEAIRSFTAWPLSSKETSSAYNVMKHRYQTTIAPSSPENGASSVNSSQVRAAPPVAAPTIASRSLARQPDSARRRSGAASSTGGAARTTVPVPVPGLPVGSATGGGATWPVEAVIVTISSPPRIGCAQRSPRRRS